MHCRFSLNPNKVYVFCAFFCATVPVVLPCLDLLRCPTLPPPPTGSHPWPAFQVSPCPPTRSMRGTGWLSPVWGFPRLRLQAQQMLPWVSVCLCGIPPAQLWPMPLSEDTHPWRALELSCAHFGRDHWPVRGQRRLVNGPAPPPIRTVAAAKARRWQAAAWAVAQRCAARGRWPVAGPPRGVAAPPGPAPVLRRGSRW